MEISEILKEKRAELNMTQDELAKSLYVSKRSITNWETGRTTPDIDSLIRLAKLYDISLDDLLLDNKKAVNNIKNQAKLKSMNKYLIATVITFLAFIFILGTTGLYGELAKPVLIAAYIGGFANVGAMVYFLDQINGLENKSENELIKSSLKWMAIGVSLILVGIIAIILL